MSYKHTDPCIQKAFDNEMLFVLMARDETAPAVVMEWIKLNIGKQPEEKLREAFECAMTMYKTNAEMQIRKNLGAPSANFLDFSHEFQEAKELKIEKAKNGYMVTIPKGTILFMNAAPGSWIRMSDDTLADVMAIPVDENGQTPKLALRKYADPEVENPGYIEFYFLIDSSGIIIPQTVDNWLDGPEV